MAAAASPIPSAEEARQDQYCPGALVSVQLAPELVEIKIWPVLAATSLLPSAEEATPCYKVLAGRLPSTSRLNWSRDKLSLQLPPIWCHRPTRQPNSTSHWVRRPSPTSLPSLARYQSSCPPRP